MNKLAPAILGVTLLLAGCAGSNSTQTVTSTVDLAETGLTAANEAAAAFIKSPACQLSCATHIQAEAKIVNAAFLQLKAGSVTLEQFTADLAAYQSMLHS